MQKTQASVFRFLCLSRDLTLYLTMNMRLPRGAVCTPNSGTETVSFKIVGVTDRIAASGQERTNGTAILRVRSWR